MRALFALLVLLLVGGTACVPGKSPSQQVLAANLSDKTVALVTEHGGVYCSGVWVAPRLILTANHCVDDVKLNELVGYSVLRDVVEWPDKQHVVAHPAHLMALDEAHDLALLHADLVLPPHGVAEIATHDIAAGQPVEAMGNPEGMVFTFSTGVVASIRYVQKATAPDDVTMWYIQTTTPISHGSSGGGLWDEDGKLIGICRWSNFDAQNLNFFVHRDYVAHFVSEWGG